MAIRSLSDPDGVGRCFAPQRDADCHVALLLAMTVEDGSLCFNLTCLVVLPGEEQVFLVSRETKSPPSLELWKISCYNDRVYKEV